MFFLIKALLFTAFLILKSNLAFASTPLNYEQYDKLPCKFNGAEVGNSAYPRTEKDKSYSYKLIDAQSRVGFQKILENLVEMENKQPILMLNGKLLLLQ